MNNERFQDWLAEVNTICTKAVDDFRRERQSGGGSDGATMNRRPHPFSAFDAWRRLLREQESKTMLLMSYFVTNYHDVNLSQPLLAQLLALYYKLGE